MYIGIDDTDSVKGQCTTYFATEITKELQNFIDIIGYPRLVRLNPNVPWKTRGNGAICIRVGRGVGRKSQVADVGEAIYSYERESYNNGWGNNLKEEIFESLQEIVEKYSEFDDSNTNPGLVLTDYKPSSKLYWSGVRSIVKLSEVKKILAAKKALYKGYKNERGIIGATAAIAWRPRDRTYEIITYRAKSKWGYKRVINESSVRAMDRSFDRTFNNYDYQNKKVIIAPHSPCPVLFGIRGNTSELIEPMRRIESEKVDRWVIFETNQGTDDHLKKMRISGLKRYSSASVSGKVTSVPKTIKGGHMIFKITDDSSLDCAAYEPTKNFRAFVKNLIAGDKVTVYGSIRNYPFTLNIEKLRIEKLAEVFKKLIPICECGSKMESIGKDKGYRCRKCGVKTTNIRYARVNRKIKEGFYEVPVCAMRHLSKPLRRFAN